MRAALMAMPRMTRLRTWGSIFLIAGFLPSGSCGLRFWAFWFTFAGLEMGGWHLGAGVGVFGREIVFCGLWGGCFVVGVGP